MQGVKLNYFLTLLGKIKEYDPKATNGLMMSHKSLVNDNKNNNNNNNINNYSYYFLSI